MKAADTRLTAAFLAAALLAAAPAWAQRADAAPPSSYRPGLPAVNAPPPSREPDADNRGVAAAFSAWNARSGRPGILLFWNRQLIEDGASQYDSVTTTRVEGAADQVAIVARGRGATVGAGSANASISSETRAYQERTTDGRYGFGDGLFAKAVESSLMATLLNSGARVMDREALIRKTSAGRSRDERMDIQHLETLALAQGVQYLVEVLPDDDPGSPTGVSFTVKVIHLPSAAVRAQFVTPGDPPRGPSRLVAGPDGFERRAAPDRRTPELIGAQVAYDTMSRLR